MSKKQSGKRYSDEEKANLLGIWDAAQGTNVARFGAVQNAGYAGGLSGWLQNVRSWRGPKKAKAAPVARKAKAVAPVNVAEAAPTTTPPSAGLKRGRVGPLERAQIIEAHRSGKAPAEIAAKYGRSEKVVLALLSQAAPANTDTSSVAAALQHADPLSGIPELFRDEFVAMILEKIEQEHKHRLTNISKKDDAVRLFFQIKEVLKDYDSLIGKLKAL